MKRILSLILGLGLVLNLSAQVDRSQRPEPGPAPKLDFGDYEKITLNNGLQVIIVEDHKLPRVTMRLLVDRDPILENDKAGYVSLAGEMLRQGTTNRTKDQLDEDIDFIGARLSTGSNLIYTSGLSKYTDKLFEIMADVTMNPSFPEDEFKKLKKQTISGLESQKDDPEAVNNRVFNALLYGKDHPYGEMETIESVERVHLEDVKTYYRNYWIPNHTYLAIVGDITPKEAKKLAKKYFGEWKKANRPRHEYQDPELPSSPQIAMVNKESAVQSVMRMGNIIELNPGHPDLVALRVANQILGGGSIGRLFQNIREDKGYTYGAYSNFDDDRLVGFFAAGASVRNEVTDSALTEFLYEFNRLRSEKVSDEELQGAINYITGSFGRSLEDAQNIARFALNIERYDLPKNYYRKYVEDLQKVTAENVQTMARNYIKPDNMLISVVGKKAEVAEKLEKFGSVHFYDENANPVEAKDLTMPEDLTANQVISNYLKAIGGKEKWLNVKEIEMHFAAEITGAPMELNATILRKRPNLYLVELTAPGRGTMMKQVYDGNKGTTSGMQGNQELTGEELEDLKNEARFRPEFEYLSNDYQLELSGMSEVEGEPAYVVKVTGPGGMDRTEYYSAESGLKLKVEETIESPQGEMISSETFQDYREVEGVQIPHTIINKMGPQKITLKANEVKLNSGLDEASFN